MGGEGMVLIEIWNHNVMLDGLIGTVWVKLDKDHQKVISPAGVTLGQKVDLDVTEQGKLAVTISLN
jgi:hypothetical protein